ncbi:hypothetical protein VTN49DRAFT_4366 [Thermomyces lanuginosus]|uniref:uncharacterized protein n=1 Tax=Thermomyces lanuginosus TaxID=5541 RepID=UPI003744272B
MAEPSQQEVDALRKRAEEAEQRLKEEKERRKETEERLKEEKERLKEEKERRKETEERLKEEKERRKEEKERRKEEKKRRKKAEEEAQEAQPTTFDELLKYTHLLLFDPLKVGDPADSTRGTIAARRAKLCPEQIHEWSDFPDELRKIFDDVYRFLKPAGKPPPRLFSSMNYLRELSLMKARRPICSENDLDNFMRSAVDEFVEKIVQALCNDPDAKRRFQLSDSIRFRTHYPRALEEEAEEDERSGTWRPRPDRYCIHRVDEVTEYLVTACELKPPHKLDAESLRTGLRDMDFVREVVQQDTRPSEENENTKSSAERLVGATLTQVYDVMIREGLEYSYISTGLAFVFLRVPKDEFWKLYYYLCEPKVDAYRGDTEIKIENTAVARVLCFCLMSSQSSPPRNQVWRNQAEARLRTWDEHYNAHLAQACDTPQTPPGADHTTSGSEYVPSPRSERVAEGRRIVTRSMANRCRPSESSPSRPPHADSSDSDNAPVAQGRKRSFSQVTSSLTSERASSTRSKRATSRGRGGSSQQHSNRFCTQRCLLGLQHGGPLDDACPNVSLHRQGSGGDQHQINASELVQAIKRQLDQDPEHYCTPMGGCGSYGAPFKITCARYGYTIFGKGTTSYRWKDVSQEVDVYRILQKVQGSAVPVFLGAIDMAQTYHLHGVGGIQYMLLMGWAGEKIRSVGANPDLSREIMRSKEQIKLCGVVHLDLRLENMLWNQELGRVLIIDFHLCKIIPRPRKTLGRKRKASPLDREYPSRRALEEQKVQSMTMAETEGNREQRQQCCPHDAE